MLNLRISTHFDTAYTDQPHLSGLNEFKISMRFLLPSNQERMQEWTSLSEKPFHRRFTVVEDFGSKSALIKIHLSSIDMLVSVTKTAVSQQPVCLENFYK